jgi:PAS domain-containing protein
VHADGTPVVTNRPFAHLLGYESPAELQRIASTFGIFGGPAELDRLRCTLQSGSPATLLFRRKDGQRESLEVVGAGRAEAGLNALVVRRDDSAALPIATPRSA